jgi:very-short-patch-repair endonuclease
MILDYKNSLSVAKLRDEYKCKVYRFNEIEPDKQLQKNIYRESPPYTTSGLRAASQFTDEHGLWTIVRNCKRKPAAISMAIALNIPNEEAGVRCIQAKIEYLLIPYFRHWGICIEHEKTMKVEGYHFRVDMHLPQFKIAIEVDEHGHADRDAASENKRQGLLEGLGYRFVRLNPHASKRPLDLIVSNFWRTKLFPALQQQNGDLVLPHRAIIIASKIDTNIDREIDLVADPLVIAPVNSQSVCQPDPKIAPEIVTVPEPDTVVQVIHLLTNLYSWYTVLQICILYYLLESI